MNVKAAPYTPSPNLRPAMTTTVVKKEGHSPPIAPVTGSARPAPTSAADHLRQLHTASTKPSRPPGSQHASASTSQHQPVSSTPRPVRAGAPHTAVEPHPSASKVCYSRETLLAIQSRAIEAIRCGPITDEPPFLKIPATFAPLLRQSFALEYVDVDAASALVEQRGYASPFAPLGQRHDAAVYPAANGETTHASGNEGTDVRNYHCPVCCQGGESPCPALAEVIRNATRYAMRTKEGACLLQAPEVVTGLLQLLLVFESKKSSMRMRRMAEDHPSIVRRVMAFLCGEGYHLPLPPVTAHDSWRDMMSLLKFDAIRDNRTRIIHDFSKHWKKRHTPFEQFVFFFSFRYAVPIGTAKNIPTCSVKPGMVAMLSGDVMAMVLLHHLNFFIPPDYYWRVYPYLHQTLGEGSLTYDVIRHLGVYMSCHQDSSAFYNPIEDPASRA